MKQKRTTGWPFFADPAKHRALVGDPSAASTASQHQLAMAPTPRRPTALSFEKYVGEPLTYDFSQPHGNFNELVLGKAGEGMSSPAATTAVRRTRSWK